MNRERVQEILGFIGRQAFIALSIVVFLVAAGVAVYFYRVSSAQSDEYQQLNDQGQKMLATRKLGPVLRSQLARVKEAVRRIDSNLADERDLSGNREYFEAIAAETRVGFELESLIAPAAEIKHYRAVPFTIRVNGSYPQVQAFLYKVESGPRLANITSIGIRRANQVDGEIDLEMNLELLGRP